MPWFISEAGVTLPILIPLAWLAAALLPCLRGCHRSHWHLAQFFASGAVVIALVLVGLVARNPAPTGITSGAGILAFRTDGLSAAVILMTTIIGWSILRFSRNYLAGDPGARRFTRWFTLTLASVSALVLADHLALLALAWLATSLSLHQLLVFYPERPKALLAAHKKFLVSRLADTLLIAGFLLLAHATGSAEITTLNQRLMSGAATGGPALEAAALLIVLSAALKSAQLPFHGWLIQVMEAPTPVSALLHAGVVNMGGYILIRLSPMLEMTQSAAWLLLVIALVTVVVASLVMMTRISIKVMLAWSTTAQMGFMMLECALGLYHLALVHLLAHSFYKAHTFLSSGQAPLQSLIRRSSTAASSAGLASRILAPVAGLMLLLAGHYAFGKTLSLEVAVTGVVIVTTITILLTELGGSLGLAGWLKGAAAALVITGAYLLAGDLFSAIVAPSVAASAPAMLLAASVLILLLVARLHIMLRPNAALWRRTRPLLFNGLYLDEAFTRATFKLWPPRPRPPRELPEPAPIYPDEGVSS